MSQILDVNSPIFTASFQADNGNSPGYYTTEMTDNFISAINRNSFQVKLWADEEGRIVAKCQELGVASDGANEDEALINIKEGIDAYLEANGQYEQYKDYNIIAFQYVA